jgi:hypothetical protein
MERYPKTDIEAAVAAADAHMLACALADDVIERELVEDWAGLDRLDDPGERFWHGGD